MTGVFWWPVVAMLASAATTGGLLRSGLAARLAMDEPTDRSLHRHPIPRCGGIGIVLAIVLVAGAAFPEALVLVLLAAMLAAISWLDDRHDLPVVFRLATQVAAAGVALASFQGLAWPVILVLTVSIVWATNLFNFMDGSNGLAGGMAMIGFGFLGCGAWLAGHPALASVCWVVAAAALGFLFFNFNAARVFMGDVGSIPLGFLAATFGLHGWREGAWPAVFPLLVFSPFLLDATLTLLKRLFAGRAIWRPHREHYYQRLILMGWSHVRVAMAYYCLMLLGGGVGVLASGSAVSAQWALTFVALAAIFALFVRVDFAWRRYRSS